MFKCGNCGLTSDEAFDRCEQCGVPDQCYQTEDNEDDNDPSIFAKVADILCDNGFDAAAEVSLNNQPCIAVAGRGCFFIMAEGDRGYYWKGERNTEKGGYFTFDLYLSDGLTIFSEEIADSLLDLLSDC